MSKRRHTRRRPVEDLATDRLAFTDYNHCLQAVLLETGSTYTGSDLLLLLQGGQSSTISEILPGSQARTGDDALDILAADALIATLRDIPTSDAFRRARELFDAADLDRLARRIDWLVAQLRHEGEKEFTELLHCRRHDSWIEQPRQGLGYGPRFCTECPCPMPARGRRGRRAQYCTTACRVAACRRRKRGVEKPPMLETRPAGMSEGAPAQVAPTDGRDAPWWAFDHFR